MHNAQLDIVKSNALCFWDWFRYAGSCSGSCQVIMDWLRSTTFKVIPGRPSLEDSLQNKLCIGVVRDHFKCACYKAASWELTKWHVT